MGTVHKKGHGHKGTATRRPPPSSGKKRHHDQAAQRPHKPATRGPPKNSWIGLIAGMLGIGTSNGEEHDGVFVSGKPAKRLSDTIKDRLMSEKRPDKTLLLLYAAFEQACERRHDINRAESGGLAAKMYKGVPIDVKTLRCKSIMRSASLYSRIQDGLIRVPCSRIRLGSGSITDLIPFVGGSGAALINFFFFFSLLSRIGLNKEMALGILVWRLLTDAVFTAIPGLGAINGALLQTTLRLAWTTSTWALLRDVLEDSEGTSDEYGILVYRSRRLAEYFGGEDLPFTTALLNVFGGKHTPSSNV